MQYTVYTKQKNAIANTAAWYSGLQLRRAGYFYSIRLPQVLQCKKSAKPALFTPLALEVILGSGRAREGFHTAHFNKNDEHQNPKRKG